MFVCVPQVLLACLAAVAAAAPQFGGQPDFRPDYRPIAILRDEREDFGDGNFRYEFETENGILTNAVGTPGAQGQSNIQGFFRYVRVYGISGETSNFMQTLCFIFFTCGRLHTRNHSLYFHLLSSQVIDTHFSIFTLRVI